MAELKQDGQVEDLRLDELTGLGADGDEAAAWLAAQAPEGEGDEDDDEPLDDDGPLVVWPENWPVVKLFLLLQTQWRRTAEGALDSLRWDAAELAMKRLRLKHKRRLFEHLVEMEHAALEAWHERQH